METRGDHGNRFDVLNNNNNNTINKQTGMNFTLSTLYYI